VKNKGLRFVAVASIVQCFYNGIKFFIICRVVELWATKLLTKVGYGLYELTSTTLMPTPLVSHSTLNNSLMLGNAKIGASHNLYMIVLSDF